MLLAMKPQFTRITTITNKLNNVCKVKEIYRPYIDGNTAVKYIGYSIIVDKIGLSKLT